MLGRTVFGTQDCDAWKSGQDGAVNSPGEEPEIEFVYQEDDAGRFLETFFAAGDVLAIINPRRLHAGSYFVKETFL